MLTFLFVLFGFTRKGKKREKNIFKCNTHIREIIGRHVFTNPTPKQEVYGVTVIRNQNELVYEMFLAFTHTSFFCDAAGSFLFGAAPLILPST